MDEIFYNETGMKVIKNIAWIPEQTFDYNRKYVTIPELIRWTGIDRGTIHDYIGKGIIKGVQDIYRQWKLELKSVIHFVEKKYRYKNYGLKTGSWWDKKAIQPLYSDESMHKLSKKLGRNKNCIKVMRCKLGIPRINNHFEQAYFVTPHAIKRYRERILNIPDKYLIWNILDGLKKKVVCQLSRYEGKTYFCLGRHPQLNFKSVVIENKNKEEWPQVVTILNE
ncbi:MAG: hypothetical protein ACFFG0_05460 [Candidatus Thorarchaeota archaeon]